jgi:hypothetical protein
MAGRGISTSSAGAVGDWVTGSWLYPPIHPSFSVHTSPLAGDGQGEGVQTCSDQMRSYQILWKRRVILLPVCLVF